mgnify:CR=1 FL=1
MKRALVDITTAMLNSGLGGANTTGLQDALSAEHFNVLAQLTGTKVIHIAERDTQVTDRPKEVGEFVNTWSGEGFYEEGISPAELGWGTHERTLPARALEHRDFAVGIAADEDELGRRHRKRQAHVDVGQPLPEARRHRDLERRFVARLFALFHRCASASRCFGPDPPTLLTTRNC